MIRKNQQADEICESDGTDVTHMAEPKMVVAAKGIVEYEGKLLIVKRAEDDEVDGGAWELPGGKIDFGEEPEAALIREIREEAGVGVTVGGIMYASSFLSDPARQVIILAYRCTADGEAVTLSFEHSDYRWVNPGELGDYLPEKIMAEFRRYGIV